MAEQTNIPGENALPPAEKLPIIQPAEAATPTSQVTLDVFRGVSKTNTPNDVGMYGKGTYYTTDKSYAEGYAVDGHVISARVTLRNPFLPRTEQEITDLGEAAYRNSLKSSYSESRAGEARSQGIRETLEAWGYDGIIFDNGARKDIVVFHPEQAVAVFALKAAEPINTPTEKG